MGAFHAAGALLLVLLVLCAALDLWPVAVLLGLMCGLGALGVAAGKRTGPRPGQARPVRYPFRPGVEFRLPDGRITTRGYAARHPAEFAHWKLGPGPVYGEYIDRTDWENWYSNYYGG